MCGKRSQNAVEDRLLCRTESVSSEQSALLNFILANAQNDERPYLEVTIFDKPILGLLDSGASRTIAGHPLCDLLMDLGLPTRENISTCTAANGISCEVTGIVSTPVRIRDQVKLIDILLVPSVTHPLILGADFWRIHGIVPDLRRGEWTFSNEPPVASIEHITSHLSPDQQQQLQSVIRDLFPACKDGELGCTNLVSHDIICTGQPIKQRYYPISRAMQKIVDAELDEMLRLGVVQKSSSPWSSPILMVPKKGTNKFRFCVDYRKLNQVTQRDAYPLPYVSQTLDKLRDAKYLSSLDVKSAYWQIPMSEHSRQFTAFTVPNRGLFEFLRLPYGLTNAPATWMRFIDRVLGPELEPNVFVYLDDIIIVTQTFEKH